MAATPHPSPPRTLPSRPLSPCPTRPSPPLPPQISGPNDATEYTQTDLVSSKFSFTADVGGSHKLCFTNGASVRRTVELDWASGAAAIDYSDVARVEQLKPLELEMRKLEDRLTAVRKEMQFQREREEAHRDTVRGGGWEGGGGGARLGAPVRSQSHGMAHSLTLPCSPWAAVRDYSGARHVVLHSHHCHCGGAGRAAGAAPVDLLL
jgi:hypothetical protein